MSSSSLRPRWPRILRARPAAFAIGFVIAGVTAARSDPGLTRTPFSPASRAPGSTLFTRLDPAATGITVTNPYDDPAMWGSRYRAFMGGAMGSGIAAGDFDGDGKVDLYISTKTHGGRLYRNLGNWKFQDVTREAGLDTSDTMLGWLKSAVSRDAQVTWGQGAVFADVNNDRRLDLYVCRNRAANLLYINQGDGTFKEEAAERGLGIVDGSVVGAFADYDRDGALDVLVLMNQMEGTEPFGRPARLFHNDGHGHFTEVTRTAGITGDNFGHAAVWFDYDHDGWPDLYITNDFSGPDRLFRNNHDGTFTNVIDAAAPHTPYSSMGADTGDIDNDGNLDLFAADMATTTREKDRRGLAASRGDVQTAAAASEKTPQYMRNMLLLNTGCGVFREAACWAGLDATDWTWSVRFEDFDNDGWPDLHVTNGMVREANNSDLLSRMMRALTDADRIKVMKQSPPLAESNLAYRNRHGAMFEPVTAAWGLEDIGVSFGSVTADFDNDGDLDLAYLNYDGGVAVFRNDVAGRHRIDVRLHGTRSNRFGVDAVVRVDSARSGPQTRVMTVARGYASGSELVAHFGLGADDKVRRLVVEWPSGARQEFHDLDADYAYVVTERESGAAEAAASPPPLFRPQTGEFGLAATDQSPPALPDQEQAFLPFRTDRRGPGVAVADIDGDGHDDVYVAATTGSPARWWRWSGGKYRAENAGRAAGKVEEGPPLLLDVDGNGTKDLLCTTSSANATAWPEAYQPVLYSNDGHGHFTATDWLPDLRLNVGAVAAADIDGDGRLDLFIGGRSVPGRYPVAPRSVLLRNDHGRFVDVTAASPALANVGLVKSALFRDVDLDGRPDLVLALEWDFVRYFHNDGNGAFADWTEKAGFNSGGRGWWNSLASADCNGDGRPDFAAGNLGLNTPYHATPAHPAVLLYGDFAGNGTKQIVEAVYDGPVLYPLRARADLATRFPFILRRFPHNDDFARADLQHVFDERAVSGAARYTADNLSSGVFLSQPDGTYRFQPLPPIAQIGPVEGLVAADLDGDGEVDLCAVQNTDAAVPHFDGGIGILLKGLGGGRFEPRRPAVSGIVVPGNGRALVEIDPDDDGAPDLFITRQGGPTEFLQHGTGGRWVRLELRDGQGNPDAVGAVIRVAYANGIVLTQEVSLGGGWLSQAAPGVFVPIPAGTRLNAVTIRWPEGNVSHAEGAPDHGRWVIRNPRLAPAREHR